MGRIYTPAEHINPPFSLYLEYCELVPGKDEALEPVVPVEGLLLQLGQVVSLQVYLCQDVELGEGVLVDGLYLAVPQGDLLEVDEADGAEGTLHQLLDVVTVQVQYL